jgi:hypothetical protein
MGDNDAPIISLLEDTRVAEFNAEIAALAPVGEDSHATAWHSTSLLVIV